MSRFSAIDLSQLPAPDLVETLDYEAVLAALLADFTARYPDFSAAVESEPVVKLLEVSAYRELILRGRINDAARGVMLAFATGTDLDQLGAWWGVTRRLLDAGDPAAVPPVAPTYETDDAFRDQIQTSLEAHTTAGPIGSYRWHALQTDPTLLDVGVSSPNPGVVLISVLAADGSASAEQLAAIVAALNAEDVRPLCDTVDVEAATLIPYDVTATLHLAAGPDADTVEAAALAAAQAYCDGQRQCGARIARSALFAALHQPGVQWIGLSAPSADVRPDSTEAPWLGTITLTIVQEAV